MADVCLKAISSNYVYLAGESLAILYFNLNQEGYELFQGYAYRPDIFSQVDTYAANPVEAIRILDNDLSRQGQV